MVLATIFLDDVGCYEISGEVLPFGVFSDEIEAKKAFDKFIKENNQYKNHILDIRNVELNKPYDIVNTKDSPTIVTWMYIE